MMADEPPITSEDEDEDLIVYDSVPPNAAELLLQQKFTERYAAQGEQLDALARQMITIELAIPGLYAAVLALLYGDKATVAPGLWIYVAFGCWFLSLIATFVALFPRTYNVDTAIQRADPEAGSDVLGIEDFFRELARYKYWWLVAAAVLFCAGLAAAIILLLSGSGIVVPPPAAPLPMPTP